MKASEKSVMKIYASSTDKVGSQLLYTYIVKLARERGVAGATVFRGIMGYGPSSSRIASSTFWELTEKLPVLIEIIDTTEVLQDFIKIIEPELYRMPKGCLVTLEPVHVLLHKPGKRD